MIFLLSRINGCEKNPSLSNIRRLRSVLMNIFYIGLVVLVGIVATGLFLRFILSSSGKSNEVFEAIDGTKFSRKQDLNEYEFLYERLRCLYEDNLSANQRNKNVNLGLSLSFIQQLRADGFSNLNSLISNKEQFKKLSNLFELSEMSSNLD